MLLVFLRPELVCGVGLLYISFIAQIIENIIFDRFITSFVLNVIIVIMEINTHMNHLELGLPMLAFKPPGHIDDLSVQPVGYIWKSLKDISVIGTLFPILISFDMRKVRGAGKQRRSHNGTWGYFFNAFFMFSFALVGITVGRVMQLTADIPLCLSTSIPVFIVVFIQSLIQGDFLKLITFNSSAQLVNRRVD
jgi:hypothetical protein